MGQPSSGSRQALEAICDALVPEGGAVETGALTAGAPARIEEWMREFTPSSRRLTQAMIAAFDLSPLLSRHLRRFRSLDTAGRQRWLEASTTTRFRPRREALAGLRTIVNLAYALDPGVQAQIGYDGAPLVPLDHGGLPEQPALAVTEHPDVPDGLDCDVVIVGSGAGGAVAAHELATAGLTVVVLEEGGQANGTHCPGTLDDGLFGVYRDNGLTNTFGTPLISLPMGRAVGGTTVINSGTCFRTPEWILHSWSRLGLDRISPDDMAPIFDDVEDVIGVAPVPDETLGANGAVFRRGAAALGYSGGPIRRNARHCHGHGRCAFGCPIDAKQGMAVSYLPRAVAAGARVFAHCRVDRIEMQSGRAAGVHAVAHDPLTDSPRSELRVRARAVVLAAGAIFTPALLARQHLAGTSGQLGRNLVVHPGAGTTALFDEALHAWRGVMQSYFVDAKLRDGILLEATFPPPGIGYSAGSLPGIGLEMKRYFARFPQMAACGSIISDAGSGRVTPTRRGAVIRYSLAPDDVRKVVEGIAAACEIYLAAGATEVYPMLPGYTAVRTRGDVERLRSARIRRSDLKLSAYHPMGTARMGTDPASSVVDAWGRVHDADGLWILDASVMPSSTAVNPQITIMALAARGARRLADQLT